MKKYRTLFEKLRPQYRDRLVGEVREKYPSTYHFIIQELHNKYFITQLNYGIAIDIFNYLGGPDDDKNNRMNLMFDFFESE